MRIFSNFDTNLKQRTLERYQAQFGKENVLLIGKSKLFWMVKIIIPFIFYVFLGVAILYGSTLIDPQWIYYLGIPVDIILLLFVGRPLLKKYVDYKMDFTIITPNLLMMYDQGGVFKRNIITVNAINIKTITVQKSGLLYSIFNNGDITFLSEGDDSEHGEIVLKRVNKPERQRHALAIIMGRV